MVALASAASGEQSESREALFLPRSLSGARAPLEAGLPGCSKALLLPTATQRESLFRSSS